MARRRTLTNDDYRILIYVNNASTVKEGLQRAAKDMDSNYYSIKNRWYNYIQPTMSDENNSKEFIEYYESLKMLCSGLDPSEVNDVILEFNETYIMKQWKIATLEVKRLQEENRELREENERLRSL